MTKHLSFILLLVHFYIYPQTNSLDQKHLKFVIHFTHTNNDSLIFYARKLQESNVFCTKLSGMMSEAKGHYQKSDFSTAEKIAKTVLKRTKDNNDECINKNKIDALIRLFYIKKNQGNLIEAYNYLLKRRKIITYSQKKDIYYLRQLLSIDTDIATLKSKLGMHKDAKTDLIKINNKINQIPSNQIKHNKNNFLLQKTSILNKLGDTYFLLQKDNIKPFFHLDSAMKCYKKSYEISKQFNPPHKNSKVIFYLNKAKIHIAKKEFKKALSALNKIKYQHFEQSGDFLKIICFSNLEKNDSTEFYSYKYLNSSSPKKKNIPTIYNILSKNYFKKNEIDSAYKYSELTLKEVDFFDKNKNSTINLLYNNDLNEIKNINKTLISKTKLQKNKHLFLLILFILLFMLFMLYSYRKRKNLISKFEITSNRIFNKKEYNITSSLEAKILNGLQELESSQEYIYKDFSIQVLAKKLNTNTSYLSTIINKNKQHTFKQYITKLRIDYLQKLLREDKKYRNYTVKALGEEIGYTNASAFSRAFKKYTSMTPSEYINSIQ